MQGVLSYAGEDAVVVSDEETLPIGDKSASILFQTTILPEKFEKIEKNTKNFEKTTINQLAFSIRFVILLK